MNDFQEGSKAEDMNLSIEEILSGEDFDSLAKSVKRDFDDHERDMNEIVYDAVGSDSVQENMREKVNEVAESFVISLDEAFKVRKEIDEGVGKYVKENLKGLVYVYEGLNDDQKNVLKGWLILDYYRFAKKIQIQELPNLEEEIDSAWIWDPSIEFDRLVKVYGRMLGR